MFNVIATRDLTSIRFFTRKMVTVYFYNKLAQDFSHISLFLNTPKLLAYTIKNTVLKENGGLTEEC